MSLRIEIYGRDDCRFCAAAKAYCHKKGYPFAYHDLTANPFLGVEMLERISDETTTVPQIFIGEHHIGGFDDLKANDAVVQQLIGGH